MKWWQFRKRRHCPHVHVRGVYGDEIIHTPGYRRIQCLNCGRLLDGPAIPASGLPEFVNVISRTGTSARWWCDECDWCGGWASPREAWDGAYRHVQSKHPNLT